MKIGTSVVIDFNMDYIREKVKSVRYWNKSLAKYLASQDECGTVVDYVIVNDDGAARVQLESGDTWWYPLNCLKDKGCSRR